jgi:hypothetical protein
MMEFADSQLDRRGRLITALGSLYAQQLAKRPETEQFMRTHGRRRKIEKPGNHLISEMRKNSTEQSEGQPAKR